jgi:hypothetical protein
VPLSNLKVKDNQTQCLSLILSAAKGHKLMCISFISTFIKKWVTLSYLLPILKKIVGCDFPLDKFPNKFIVVNLTRFKQQIQMHACMQYIWFSLLLWMIKKW